MKRLRTLKSFQIFKIKIKKSKHIAVDVLFKAYPMNSQGDPIWPDATFKNLVKFIRSLQMKQYQACGPWGLLG
jgi:hypothetical protein